MKLKYMLGWIVKSHSRLSVIKDVKPKVTTEVRSPDGRRAEVFLLRHLGNDSGMLGLGWSLLKLLEPSLLTDSMQYQGCQRGKLCPYGDEWLLYTRHYIVIARGGQ